LVFDESFKTHFSMEGPHFSMSLRVYSAMARRSFMGRGVLSPIWIMVESDTFIFWEEIYTSPILRDYDFRLYVSTFIKTSLVLACGMATSSIQIPLAGSRFTNARMVRDMTSPETVWCSVRFRLYRTVHQLAHLQDASAVLIAVNASAAVACKLKVAMSLNGVGAGLISMTQAPELRATRGREAAGCTRVEVPMEKHTSQ
jgi:hypothetical protein